MHQSVYWNERLGSRVTNYIPTFLLLPFFLVHPPSVSLSLSLFLCIPAPDPCLSPAFLPHSEIPREQAMISNGGALRRRPCSFPFFSVRSSCSSSFCREESPLCTPSFLLTSSYLLSEGISGDPRAPLGYHRPRPLPSSLPYRARRDRRYWSAIDLVIPAD